jgi:spermidine synthase
VIEISKTFLPFMAKGLTHSKVNLYIGNGCDFVKEHTNEFDVIITDSSDPIGKIVKRFKYIICVNLISLISSLN